MGWKAVGNRCTIAPGDISWRNSEYPLLFGVQSQETQVTLDEAGFKVNFALIHACVTQRVCGKSLRKPSIVITLLTHMVTLWKRPCHGTMKHQTLTAQRESDSRVVSNLIISLILHKGVSITRVSSHLMQPFSTFNVDILLKVSFIYLTKQNWYPLIHQEKNRSILCSYTLFIFTERHLMLPEFK